MSKNIESQIENFIKRHEKWESGLRKLYEILSKTELEVSIKWGSPVFYLDNKNVVGLTAFKNHFSLWFYQGVFLKDAHGLLVNAQEGKTKAMRHLRFHDTKEIKSRLVTSYVKEAIQNQKAGKEIKQTKKPSTYVLAPELKHAFSKSKSLKKAFEALSMYRQKEFSEYISSAKREETKQRRLKKIIPLIKEGKTIY